MKNNIEPVGSPSPPFRIIAPRGPDKKQYKAGKRQSEFSVPTFRVWLKFFGIGH